MLQILVSLWCSTLHTASIALLSVLGEGSLTCGSLWGFYILFTLLKVLFFCSSSLLLLRVKGRGCHTLLKPDEKNCNKWKGAIQIKFDWWPHGSWGPQWLIVVESCQGAVLTPILYVKLKHPGSLSSGDSPLSSEQRKHVVAGFGYTCRPNYCYQILGPNI